MTNFSWRAFVMYVIMINRREKLANLWRAPMRFSNDTVV